MYKSIPIILRLLLSLLLSESVQGQSTAAALRSFDTGHTITKIRIADETTTPYLLAGTFEGKLLAISYEGTLLWENELSGYMHHDLWCEDLDGDGRDEILAANADGSIYCLDHSGQLKWSFRPSSAPMYAVCAIREGDRTYVVCGGFDKSIYYLNADGELVKEIPSSTYSSMKTFGSKAPPSGEHIANFLRKYRQSDGTEHLILSAANNSMQVKGELYFFEALADQPYRTVVLQNRKPLGDLRVSRYFGDGQEEILAAPSGHHSDLEILNYRPNNGQNRECPLHQRSKDLGGFAYRVGQTEVIPYGDSYRYLSLIGQNIVLIQPDLELTSAEIITADYAFNDMWHDAESHLIVLAGSQSGGSAIHLLDYTDENWKAAFQSLQPPGKIQAIRKHTQELQAQLDTFTAPSWERTPKTVYFVSDRSANGSTPEALEQKMEDLQQTYGTPHFLGNQFMRQVQDPADWNRDTMSNAFYRDRRDRRKDYALSESAILDIFSGVYQQYGSLATWGGHGNDPYFYSLPVKKKLLDLAAGGKTVLIYPELEKDDANFEYVLDHLLYPLADYAKDRNANIHLRNKHLFWQGPAHKPLWQRLSSGEFADVFVPSMEETTDKSMELSLSARMGFWLSGAVNQWGTRAVPDNASYDRLRQHSNQRLPNHFLRQLVYAISSGATHLNNFPVDQEYMSLLWELIAKGALYVPERKELLHLSPVHLSMSPMPDEYYLNEGANVKWLTFYDADKEAENPLVFSRLNGSWPGAPFTDWDFSRYAANEKERRLNFIPAYNNGLVLITIPQSGAWAQADLPRGQLTDHLHPFYKNILQEYYTDGRFYYSADGANTYFADEYYLQIQQDIEAKAQRLPLTVSGDAGWVVAQTDSLHLRLTLVDGGWINPADRTAEVHFHSAKAVGVKDLLSGQNFEINSGQISVDIPCGMFRFLDITLAEPLRIADAVTSTIVPEDSNDLPGASIRLSPNPAQQHTQISYTLPERMKVHISVTDSSGREVQELSSLRQQSSGQHDLIWQTSDYAPGMYFIRFQMGHHQYIRKIVLK